MKEKMMISIAEPCAENWDQMTPVEQGRYCRVCKKNVIDFANSGDEEIIEYFKNFNGNTCGSFREDQLNRPIEKTTFQRTSAFLKYAASLLLPASLLTSKSFAQKGQVILRGEVAPVISAMPVAKLPVCNGNDSTRKIIIGGARSVYTKRQSPTGVFISGRVIDANDSTGLQGVTISFDGKNGIAVTNDNGYFLLAGVDIRKNTHLTISSVGYENAQIDMGAKDAVQGVLDLKNIILKREEKMLGEVVVDGFTSRRMGGAVGSVVIMRYTTADTINNWFVPSSIKVFPNPVAKSGALSISFNGIKTGIYQIRLINSACQLFFSMQKQISKNQTEQIHLNEHMTGGIYFLQVIDEKNKLTGSCKVFVQ